MQLRVLKTVLSLPLLGPLTGLVLEWISYLELMGPVRVFQEFWHALVMLVSFLVFMLVVCNFFVVVLSLNHILPFLFLQNLLRREPLKLVDGGQSQRTFVYIKDAIEAVHLMIVCWLWCHFGLLHMLLLNLDLSGLLLLRKILLGQMVRYSMWVILIMKLQSGS